MDSAARAAAVPYLGNATRISRKGQSNTKTNKQTTIIKARFSICRASLRIIVQKKKKKKKKMFRLASAWACIQNCAARLLLKKR